VFRLKFRRDRRPTFPREPVWLFYPKYFTQFAVNQVRWVALYLRLRRLYLRMKRDPRRFQYTDVAMTPVADEDISTLEIFRTGAAKAYVGQQRRLANIRRGDEVSAEPAVLRQATPSN